MCHTKKTTVLSWTRSHVYVNSSMFTNSSLSMSNKKPHRLEKSCTGHVNMQTYYQGSSELPWYYR